MWCTGFWTDTWTVLRSALEIMYNKVAASEQDAGHLKESTTVLLLGFDALMTAGDKFVEVCSCGPCIPVSCFLACTITLYRCLA